LKINNIELKDLINSSKLHIGKKEAFNIKKKIVKSKEDFSKLKVFLCPGNHDYIKSMKKKLEERDVEVASVNYISPLTLFKIIRLRLKGYQIIHIHFVYSFPFIWLMKIFVYLAIFLGYKLAWTGHSIIPPEEKNVYKNKWFYNHADIRFLNHKAQLKKNFRSES